MICPMRSFPFRELLGVSFTPPHPSPLLQAQSRVDVHSRAIQVSIAIGIFAVREGFVLEGRTRNEKERDCNLAPILRPSIFFTNLRKRKWSIRLKKQSPSAQIK